jgi:FkbM family methyltransferase
MLNSLYDSITRISRKLTFLPRGRIGVSINKLFTTGKSDTNCIVQFKANNNLTYICDLRSSTENYVPWTGEYEGITLKNILPIIPKDMNALDIGANVGYWSLNLAQTVNLTQKVFAFEPIKSNYERIVEHLKVNKMENKVTVFNVGLGDKIDRADFNISELDKSNKSKTFNASLRQSVTGVCDIVTLDSLVEENNIVNIGFIKIDVEGYEIKALRGAKNFLEQNRPIIYGEFTPNLIESVHDKPEEIFNLLQDYYFYQENVDHSFTQLKGTSFHRDLLIIPKEKLEYVKGKVNLQ